MMMPVEKVDGGWRWGKSGKVYPTKEEAEKQEAAAYANGYVGDAMAFDRMSARTKDNDGRLYIGTTNISKSNICPYMGREIPGYESLGLDPDKIYMMYRDPDELKKSADSFNNLPVLSEHIPVSAAEPQKEIIIGSTGTDGMFVYPYLKNSMVIWDGDAIDNVESEKQKEISCAYYFDPDMTPGDFKGEHYDGIMRNIRGNHVAVVPEGRAGSDVVVADSKLKTEETAMPKPNKPIAQDEELEGKTTPVELPAEDEVSDVVEFLKDKLDPEILAKVAEMLKPAEKQEEAEAAEQQVLAGDEEEVDPEKAKEAEKAPAMDAAFLSKKLKEVEASTIKRFTAIADAKEDVRSYVGKIAIACDSAEGVYKAALDLMHVDVAGVHPSAYRAILMAQPKRDSAPKESIAFDSAMESDLLKLIPDAGRIRQL
jgi:hypothetical protein